MKTSDSRPSDSVGGEIDYETPNQFLKRHNYVRDLGCFSQHHQLRSALTKRGFVVRQVEKFDESSVWSVVLRPGEVAEGREPNVIRHEVSEALHELGQRCRSRDVMAMARGSRLVAAFIWEGGGKPGRLLFSDQGWKCIKPYEDWPY